MQSIGRFLCPHTSTLKILYFAIYFFLSFFLSAFLSFILSFFLPSFLYFLYSGAWQPHSLWIRGVLFLALPTQGSRNCNVRHSRHASFLYPDLHGAVYSDVWTVYSDALFNVVTWVLVSSAVCNEALFLVVTWVFVSSVNCTDALFSVITWVLVSSVDCNEALFSVVTWVPLTSSVDCRCQWWRR